MSRRPRPTGARRRRTVSFVRDELDRELGELSGSRSADWPARGRGRLRPTVPAPASALLRTASPARGLSLVTTARWARSSSPAGRPAGTGCQRSLPGSTWRTRALVCSRHWEQPVRGGSGRPFSPTSRGARNFLIVGSFVAPSGSLLGHSRHRRRPLLPLVPRSPDTRAAPRSRSHVPTGSNLPRAFAFENIFFGGFFFFDFFMASRSFTLVFLYVSRFFSIRPSVRWLGAVRGELRNGRSGFTVVIVVRHCLLGYINGN